MRKGNAGRPAAPTAASPPTAAPASGGAESNQDRALLRQAGISMDAAASMLKISRPHLYTLTEGARESILTQDRLDRLYTKLITSPDTADVERAGRLARLAEEMRSFTPKMSQESIAAHYLVFTNQPLEIRRPRFIDHMSTYVYPRAKVVAYFIDRHGSAEDLVDCINVAGRDAHARVNSPPWRARIVIIESQLAGVLPHLALIYDEQGDVRAELYETDCEQMVRLSTSYAARLGLLLTNAGFRFKPHDSADDFIPSGTTMLATSKGVSFNVLHDWIGTTNR